MTARVVAEGEPEEGEEGVRGLLPSSRRRREEEEAEPPSPNPNSSSQAAMALLQAMAPSEVAAEDCLAAYLAVAGVDHSAVVVVVAAGPLAVWAFTCHPAFILLRCRSRSSSRGALRSCWGAGAAWGQEGDLEVHWEACWAACSGEEKGQRAALEALWEV